MFWWFSKTTGILMGRQQSTTHMLVSVQQMLWFMPTWQVLVTSTRTTTLKVIQQQFGSSSCWPLWLSNWSSWTWSLQLWANHSEESPLLRNSLSSRNFVSWWMITFGFLRFQISSLKVATSSGWLQVRLKWQVPKLSVKSTNSEPTLKIVPTSLTQQSSDRWLPSMKNSTQLPLTSSHKISQKKNPMMTIERIAPEHKSII